MKYQGKPARAAYRLRFMRDPVPIRMARRRLSRITELDLEERERVLKVLEKILTNDLHRLVN